MTLQVHPLDELAELGKVEGSETRGTIPSSLSGQTSSTTALVATNGDIAKSGLDLGRVQERVKETKVGLTLGLAVVVQDTEKGGNTRRRGRGSKNRLGRTTDVDLEVGADEGEIRVTTVVGVDLGLLRGREAVGVSDGDVSVVVGSSEVLRVTTAWGGSLATSVLGEVSNNLTAGAVELSSTNGSDIGARCGPSAVVAVSARLFAVASNAVVSRGEENGNTLGTDLGELVASAVKVREVRATLLTTVAGRDYRRRVGGGLEVVGETNQGIVERLVIATSGGSGKVLALKRVGDTTNVLSVEVTLDLASITAVATTVDTNVLEVLEARHIRAAEGGVVGVRSTNTEETGRGD